MEPTLTNHFVFENGTFHSKTCADSFYRLTTESEIEQVNVQCRNLEFNRHFSTIVNRSKIEDFEQIKKINNRFLTHQQLVQSKTLGAERKNELKLMTLNLKRQVNYLNYIISYLYIILNYLI